jgi:hypothetical protein
MLIFWLAAAAFLFGCDLAAQEHYWTRGCLTPDGRMLGAVGDEAVLMDLQTRDIQRQIDGYFDDVVCLPNGAVVALSYDDEAIWLTEEKTVQRAGSWDVAGPISDTEIVTHNRSTTGSGTDTEFDGPMQVVNETLGENARASEPFDLLPPLFAGVTEYGAGEGPSDFEIDAFHTVPGNLLEDGRLVVAAGFPHSSDYGQPRRWGVFAVDPERRTVEPLGEPRANEEELESPPVPLSATSDGQVFAGIFDRIGEDPAKMMVAQTDPARERFRVELGDIVDVLQLSFSADGTLLAVGANLGEGEYGITMFDTNTGQELWQIPTEDNPYLLEFVGNSLVAMISDRTVLRVNAIDGQVQWKSRAEDRADE